MHPDRPDSERIDHLHIPKAVAGADRMSEERSGKSKGPDRSGVRSKQRRAQTELDWEQLHTMGTLDVEAGQCRSEIERVSTCERDAWPRWAEYGTRVSTLETLRWTTVGEANSFERLS